jgi:hypothetical protein
MINKVSELEKVDLETREGREGKEGRESLLERECVTAWAGETAQLPIY